MASDPTRRRRRPPSRRRKATRTLSRDEIARHGLRLLAELGYERFSVRRLADDLGTTPMALYHWYRNRDDLLDAVLELALSGLRPVRASVSPPLERVRRMTLAFRRLLARHPHLVPILMHRPALGPAALGHYEASLAALRSSGLDDSDAVGAYAVLYAYTLGFAAIERVRRTAGAAPPGRPLTEILADLPPAAYPTLTAIGPSIGRFTQRNFEFGLDLLLAGLAARKTEPPG